MLLCHVFRLRRTTAAVPVRAQHETYESAACCSPLSAYFDGLSAGAACVRFLGSIPR